MMSDKVYIETLGCPKNFNDSEVLKAKLIKKSFEIVNNPEFADIIIVNTCGFINDAKKESIDTIFEMSKFQKKLVVSGCLSQRYHKELMEELPEVDLFVGVNDYDELPILLNDKNTRYDGVLKECNDILEFEDRVLENSHFSATLKIAEGCNNNCAYCVIPSIRGKFRSKRIEDCIKEANYLADKGVKELILIAQDVSNYGVDLYGKYYLPELLKELCKIDKIHWIRLMYCYEDRITDELIDVIKKEKKICKYIDIPIQHSSSNVLKNMCRRSTHESVNYTIDKLRQEIENIRIRTTLIVGFPNESEDDYLNLLEFVRNKKFDRLGVFSYSREENTKAYSMKNQISEDIKMIRLEQIMEEQRNISYELNSKMIGKTIEVLVEGIDEDGSYYGRTEYDAPEIDNAVLFTSNRVLNIGDFVNVKIIDAYDYDLIGELK